MEKQGYHANVQQTGNVVMVAPTYYEKGKAPISDLEQKEFDEYKERVDKALANTNSEAEKQKTEG